MKRFYWTFCFVIVAFLFTPSAFAQYHDTGDHVELGVFGEYYRWGAGGDTGLTGVGGRISLNVVPVVQLEGEVSYDFSQVFTEGFTAPGSGGTVSFTSRTNVRRVDGLFGPKLETNKGPVRLFITAKGGAESYNFTPRAATFGTFTSTLENLRDDNMIAEFYPGGGVEAFLGPIGLRLDVGDEMYFSHGVHQNLRLTFGPSIRF